MRMTPPTEPDKLLRVKKLVEQSRKAYKRRQDKLSAPYLSVSVGLAKVIYRKKLVTPFTVYLALKFADRSGIIDQDTASARAASILGHKDTRTARKVIEQCVRLQWISTDGERLFIRGFHSLEKRYEVTSRTAGVLRETDLKNIREWILSHFLTSRYRAFRRVRKKGRALQRWKSLTNSRECSISVIADELNLSRAGACKLKKRAMKLGYFRAKNRTEQLKIDPAYKDIAAGLLDDPGLFIEAGHVFRRLTDWFSFNIDQPGGLRLHHFTKRPRYVTA